MTALQKALDLFHATAPRRPYCADDPREGQFSRSREEAFRHRHIQPNTAGKVTWLCFDCDVPGSAIEWQTVHVPAPTLVMENPRNGHAHLAYALDAPVPKTDAARLKPLRYLAAVNEGLRRILRADAGYSGGLLKTPGHEAWRTTSFGSVYSLGDLAEYMTLPTQAELTRKVKNPEFAGLGRNCMMFERLSRYGYRAVRKHWGPSGLDRFTVDLENQASELNREGEPLPIREVRAIAKSVARWIWKNFDPASFRSYQSTVGKRKGVTTRTAMVPLALEHQSAGRSQREIAKLCGVSQKTISNWLKEAGTPSKVA